jgi:predicted TIM-barrel fold metal-dependent hydrolase
MEEVDKAIEVYKPDSWKSYTIGDPLVPSKYPRRLDDEQVMYPFYEKAVKAGINTLCIHKGLLPPDYASKFARMWEHATAWDIGRVAKDWPQMNFVIYHSALRPFLELPDKAWAEFEQTGRIQWASDLAEVPQKFGVTNVYAELGTSFANSAVAHPKFCAALVGTLIKGGIDHVMWGTDSVDLALGPQGVSVGTFRSSSNAPEPDVSLNPELPTGGAEVPIPIFTGNVGSNRWATDLFVARFNL